MAAAVATPTRARNAEGLVTLGTVGAAALNYAFTLVLTVLLTGADFAAFAAGQALLLIAGMMFLMFSSRKKQLAQQSAMVTSLVPGTRVLLGSGFFGTIERLDGERADVEIAPGVVTTVLTRSILRVDNELQQTAGDDLIGRERGDEPPA